VIVAAAVSSVERDYHWRLYRKKPIFRCMTTVMGKGPLMSDFPYRWELAATILGECPPPAFAPLIEQADLVFFVGTRPRRRNRFLEIVPANAGIFILDIDSAEIGRLRGLRLGGRCEADLIGPDGMPAWPPSTLAEMVQGHRRGARSPRGGDSPRSLIPKRAHPAGTPMADCSRCLRPTRW